MRVTFTLTKADFPLTIPPTDHPVTLAFEDDNVNGHKNVVGCARKKWKPSARVKKIHQNKLGGATKYSMKFKRNVFKDIDGGMSYAEAGRVHKISPSLITYWIKKGDKEK